MKKLLSACWLLALGSAVSASTIRPGDSVIDGTKIVPYVTVWNVTVVSPDGKMADGGTWRDRVRMTLLNGRPALLREQIVDAAPPRTPEMFSVWVDPKTMAPLATQFVSVDGTSIRHEFDGKTDRVHTLTPESGFTLDDNRLALEAPAFDFYGGLFGLLLRAMPLEVGKSFTFTALTENPDPPYTSDFTAAVSRAETIPAGYMGKADTLVVELDAIKNVHYTFWIAQQAPYIIKLELRGPRGGKLIWTLPDTKPSL